MMTGYKIFDVDEKGTLRFLFHGLNRTRVVTQGKWIKANKIHGYDGSGGTIYLTGFHFFGTKEEAEQWPGDMTGRAVVKIEARGVRRKEHSKWNTYLADEIRVIYK